MVFTERVDVVRVQTRCALREDVLVAAVHLAQVELHGSTTTGHSDVLVAGRAGVLCGELLHRDAALAEDAALLLLPVCGVEVRDLHLCGCMRGDALRS